MSSDPATATSRGCGRSARASRTTPSTTPRCADCRTAGQRAEICGQQDKLKARFGIRPRLFRPPYGTYDATTLRAAADCGVAAVVLGRVPDAHRLRPGDILSASEEPNLIAATTRLLRRIQAEGFTPARLENYL